MIRMNFYNELVEKIDAAVIAYDGDYAAFFFDYIYNGDVSLPCLMDGYDMMPFYDAALNGMDIHSDDVYAAVIDDIYSDVGCDSDVFDELI